MIPKLLTAVALAYLAWRFWQSRVAAVRARVQPPAVPMDMQEKEARATLGVDANADAKAIRAAHRRLVQAVHPDRGGSADLARRINAARDTLLK